MAVYFSEPVGSDGFSLASEFLHKKVTDKTPLKTPPLWRWLASTVLLCCLEPICFDVCGLTLSDNAPGRTFHFFGRSPSSPAEIASRMQGQMNGGALMPSVSQPYVFEQAGKKSSTTSGGKPERKKPSTTPKAEAPPHPQEEEPSESRRRPPAPLGHPRASPSRGPPLPPQRSSITPPPQSPGPTPGEPEPMYFGDTGASSSGNDNKMTLETSGSEQQGAGPPEGRSEAEVQPFQSTSGGESRRSRSRKRTPRPRSLWRSPTPYPNKAPEAGGREEEKGRGKKK